jgi:hypothetical protein
VAAYDEQGNEGRSGTPENPFVITADTTPVLYGLSNRYAAAGQTVILTGNNLTASMTVTVGETQATGVTFLDGTQIQFTVPPMKPGSYAITVTDGTNTATLKDGLVYQDTVSYLQLGQGLSVVSGKSLEIPLTLGATGDVTSFYAEIQIPSSLFSGVEVDGSSVTYNYRSGVLYLTSASGSAIDVTQPVATIKLTTKAVSNETTANLTFQAGRINGTTAASLSGCTLTIYPSFTLTANVTYYGAGTQVAGVTITAGGVTETTDSSGQAVLKDITTQTATVVASRTDDSVSEAITPHDAALVLQAVVKLTDLTDVQELAGDVNRDGTVNEADAVEILKMVVGKTKTQTWVFQPTSQSVDMSPGSATVRFQAVLLGDVDSSWTEEAK